VLGGTFTGNSVAGAGGAIFNESGTLTMTSAYFMDNDAYFGGAIYNGGIATVIGTTFTKDTSLAGGALANSGQSALIHVTIQDNWAGYFGGGIYNDSMLTAASNNIVRNSGGRGRRYLQRR
jgi:hypothetical protein